MTYMNEAERRKAERLKTHLRKQQTLPSLDKLLEYRCKRIGIDCGDDPASAVVLFAEKEITKIPETLYHKTRSKENLVNILKSGAINTGMEMVVSFSRIPLPKCERGGFATIEVKTPKNTCNIPVHYGQPFGEFSDLIHIERARALRDDQPSCSNVKTEIVAGRTFEGDPYIAEDEISSACLDGRGNKKRGPCVLVGEENIVRIIPECGASREEVVAVLKDNGLEDFVGLVSEPVEEEELVNIIRDLYAARGKRWSV